jgi:hypothetical protein
MILESVTKNYSENINFLVSIDFFYMEAIESRLVWISKLDYYVTKVEINHYEKILLEIPKNPNEEEISITKPFNNAIGTRKKRKGIVIKQEVTKEGELERAQHEHENINIQEELK